MKQPSLVRLCIEIQQRNIFASTKTNIFTCDLPCKRCVDDCVQCNLHLCSTISSVSSVYMVQQPTSAPSRLIVEVSRSHTIKTHTHPWDSLNELSARRRGRYFHKTRQTQETSIRVIRGIRMCDPNNTDIYAIIYMMSCGTHLASVMHISKVHCKLRLL